jgi:hypothetical protein
MATLNSAFPDVKDVVVNKNKTDAVNDKLFAEAAVQMPLPFDSQAEYRKLLESVAENKSKNVNVSPTGSDMDQYQYLMSRERRVLDTVDRVVNDSISTRNEGSTLLGLPIHVLAMRTAGSMRALLDDLVTSRSIDDAIKALYDPLRRPYLGIALIALGVIVGILEVASL